MNNADLSSAGCSDAQLLAACGREPEAFGVLYDRYVKHVLRFCYRRTGDAEVAADLAAEVFAAAFAQRRRYRSTGAPFEAWLFGIARRQLGTYFRKQKVADRYRTRLGIEATPLTVDEFGRIEELVDMEPLRLELRAAIERLPISHQRAVWLRIGEEHTYAYIGMELNCSEGAARVRVSRGLTALADLMEKR